MKIKKIMSLFLTATFIIPFFYVNSINVKAESSVKISSPGVIGQPYTTIINGKQVTAQDYEVNVQYSDPDITTNYYEKGYKDVNEVLSKVQESVKSTVKGQNVTFTKTNKVTFKEDDIHSCGAFPQTVNNTITLSCGTEDNALYQCSSGEYTLSSNDLLGSFPRTMDVNLIDTNSNGQYNGQYALVWRGDYDSSHIPILAAEPYQGFYPSINGGTTAPLKRRPYKVTAKFNLQGAPKLKLSLTTVDENVFVDVPQGQSFNSSKSYEFDAITSNLLHFNYTPIGKDGKRLLDANGQPKNDTSYTTLSNPLTADDLKFFYPDYYDSSQYTTRKIVDVSGSKFSNAGTITRTNSEGITQTVTRYKAKIQLGRIEPSATYSYTADEDLWLPTVTYKGTVYSDIPTPQGHSLTVHYIDKDNYDDIKDVNNAPDPYTPSAPSNYILTGNYREELYGKDIAIPSNGAINEDISSEDKTIYVMCKKKQPTADDYTLNISYVDEDTNDHIDGYDSVKTYADSDLTTTVSGAKTTYYLPSLAPSGYELDTSKYHDSNGYKIAFDFPGSTYGVNGISQTNVADLKVYCKKKIPTGETGTVIKRYFLDGTEQTADENELDNVEVGSQTYYADKTYFGYTCNNSPVTVNVTANNTVYCDFKYTKDYVPPAQGTVIERYFLDGVEQTADRKNLGKVDEGIQTYYVDKSYPRYVCSNPSVTVNVTKNNTSYVDFNFKFQNNPPTVILNLPATITLGDDLPVNAVGSDPDGDTITYTWNTPTGMTGNIKDNGGTVQFNDKNDVNKEKTFTVTVTDPYGETATATATVTVVEPKPTVSISQSGTLKENRKVILSETSYGGSKSFPIDNTKTQWSFYDSNDKLINVTNAADSGIVESLDSTAGTSSMNVLFTKPGTYTIKCEVTNTNGDTAIDTKTVVIVPDELPIADFSAPISVLRDPNNDNLGVTTLTDKSSSQDSDSIDKRVWFYCFDSNNDGNDEDEEWYVYENDSWRQFGSYSDVKALVNNQSKLDTINSGNLTTVQLIPKNFNNNGQMQSHVGDYYFKEIVREKYGQPTIPDLITVKDCKLNIK